MSCVISTCGQILLLLAHAFPIPSIHICAFNHVIHTLTHDDLVTTARFDYSRLFVNKVTHVVWSPHQRGRAAMRSRPKSSTATAGISCRTSANTAEAWVPGSAGSDGKRGTCPGDSSRASPPARTRSRLRSPKR